MKIRIENLLWESSLVSESGHSRRCGSLRMAGQYLEADEKP
jgi:hypothetical protein